MHLSRQPLLRTSCPSSGFIFLRIRRSLSTMSDHGVKSGQSYEDAITKLNSLQSSYKVIEARRAAGKRLNDSALVEMRDCINRIGYNISDFNALNILHIAGTKGKGSTCAYINSILGSHRTLSSSKLPSKVGLFTSPHLLQVRERIQINSIPISRSQFAQYFFQVWNKLNTIPSNLHPGVAPPDIPKPVYFRFLTLLSLHVFMQEGVDAAIYEVGVGGTYDSTNIFEKPVATGISTLGIDHVALLGNTIEEIAGHKAGIFKLGVKAFTVPQVPSAQAVVEDAGLRKSVDLQTVQINPGLKTVHVQPDADFQRGNASLAIAMSSALLQHIGEQAITLSPSGTLPNFVIRGVEDVRWRGRCEIKRDDDGRTTWFLDGAHTADSLRVAAQWFGTQVDEKIPVRILVFNQQGRTEAVDLLKGFRKDLIRAGAGAWTHVVFCSNVTWKERRYGSDLVDHNTDPAEISSMVVQKACKAAWEEAEREALAEASQQPQQILVIPSLEEVVDLIHTLAKENGPTQVLVTGSFRHMGGILTVLEGEDADDE